MLEREVGSSVTFYDLPDVLEEHRSWNHELDVGHLSYSTQKKTKLLHYIQRHMLRFGTRFRIKKKYVEHGNILPVSERLYTAEEMSIWFGYHRLNGGRGELQLHLSRRYCWGYSKRTKFNR